MELLSKCMRLDFKDDIQDVSEKFWLVKNLLTAGILEAAMPANISICLYSVSSLTELVGVGHDVLRPEQNVADLPCWIAGGILELDAVVQTHNGGDRSTRSDDKLAFATKSFACLECRSLQTPSHEYDQYAKLLRSGHL